MLSYLLYIQFLTNPVNIIISYNSMPTFHYRCVLLIVYNPENTYQNNNSAYADFLVWPPPILSLYVLNIQFSSVDFGFIRKVHCV